MSLINILKKSSWRKESCMNVHLPMPTLKQNVTVFSFFAKAAKCHWSETTRTFNSVLSWDGCTHHPSQPFSFPVSRLLPRFGAAEFLFRAKVCSSYAAQVVTRKSTHLYARDESSCLKVARGSFRSSPGSKPEKPN